jgi:DNA-binding response OmpR family regulator
VTRILVVEDDPSIRLGLEDTLAAKGYEVEVVGSGSDGATRAASGRYDLVVLDVMLPDIDGFEVCRRIRSSKGPARRVPVIMLSARGAEHDSVRGHELGADDYVTNPFTLRELLARGVGLRGLSEHAHGRQPPRQAAPRARGRARAAALARHRARRGLQARRRARRDPPRAGDVGA